MSSSVNIDELLANAWRDAGQPSATAESVTASFVEAIRRKWNADFVGLVRAVAGNWQILATSGRRSTLPLTLMGEVLDDGAPRNEEAWHVAALSSHRTRSELLIVRGGTVDREVMTSVAAALDSVRAPLVPRDALARRVERLEALLAIAGQWNQTFELNQLLEQMAEASTRLLDAERASVFLWDRHLKTLVGRPALGVPGGELRVPDDQGIVGRVLKTGLPARVDDDDPSSGINRSVDQKLGYRTRNLVAVPLTARNGERLGVFEVLNRRRGNFTEDDEAALTELAMHAVVALENSRQFNQLLQSRNQLADQAASAVQLIGHCPAMERLRQTVERVARTDLAVLITGENGTGKEVVAQLIHYLSDRRREPLVAVNCAALPETLLESELFGHEKGAFTDARETRAGKFELAARGTLLLDEIGDMSLGGQAKLLRVLEEKVVRRVGGAAPIRTDARVIAATNQRLVELVRTKKFREDLYFRLNVATIELPPLRERGEDIQLLADHFLTDFSRKARRNPPSWTGDGRRCLLEHAWPGNVRELRNLVERLVFLCPDEQFDAEQVRLHLTPLPTAPEAIPLSLPLNDATWRFQTEYIKKQIAAARGNMTLAAERLGLHRSNLYRKMRQLGLEVDESQD